MHGLLLYAYLNMYKNEYYFGTEIFVTKLRERKIDMQGKCMRKYIVCTMHNHHKISEKSNKKKLRKIK